MKSVTQQLTRLKIFTVLSFILTSALGTVCHFAFGFFDGNLLIAPFVPVNESVWEHLKLLFFPFLLMLVIGRICGAAGVSSSCSTNASVKKAFLSCYLDGAAFGLLNGMLCIIFLFYGISGIIGRNIDWINIVIYFAATAYAHFTFYRYTSQPYGNTFSYHKTYRPVPYFLPLCVIICFVILFCVFTFYPPHIGLFKDPQNNGYGIAASLSDR